MFFLLSVLEYHVMLQAFLYVTVLVSNVYDACVCVCVCAHEHALVCMCVCMCGSFVLFSATGHV